MKKKKLKLQKKKLHREKLLKKKYNNSSKLMPCPKKKKGNPRKHTPLVSEKQRGLFGAELARRKAGKKPRMKGITTAELRRHLKESKGKKLPKKKKRKKSSSGMKGRIRKAVKEL